MLFVAGIILPGKIFIRALFNFHGCYIILKSGKSPQDRYSVDCTTHWKVQRWARQVAEVLTCVRPALADSLPIPFPADSVSRESSLDHNSTKFGSETRGTSPAPNSSDLCIRMSFTLFVVNHQFTFGLVPFAGSVQPCKCTIAKY